MNELKITDSPFLPEIIVKEQERQKEEKISENPNETVK
jgi:hypothetical protein